MKRWILACAVLLCLGLAVSGCGGGNDPEPPSDEQQINNLMDAFCSDFIAKDANSIASICSYPFSYQGSAIDSANTLKGILQAAFDSAGTIRIFEFNNRVITISGNSATVTCSERIQVDDTETTKPATLSGTKSGGEWKANSFSDI